MPAVNLNQTGFTSGELSPRVLGRTEIDRYGYGVKLCRNAHVTIQGGIKRRPGFQFVLAALSTALRASVLVPFVEGVGKAWMLEFGNNTVRIFNADRTAAGITLVSPYASADLAELDWTQSDSTLWLFHPNVPTQRLQRLADGVWVLSPAPFTTLPFAETGFIAATTGTLSAATVGTGRTLTAAAATFLDSDVGRGVISGAGLAVITGYTSTTVVTVQITRAFSSTALASGAWEVDSSPQTTCTPAAKDPVGATTTLTLGAAGWRASDVGSIVRLNGGLLKISSYTSSTVVDAVILRELAATVAAPALSWSLEPPVWSAAFGYPRSGTVYQQRLICGGNRKFPRTVWGSRIGETLDFERWTDDSDSFAFTIDADDSTAIRFITGAKELAVLTESAEYSMLGGVEKAITPTNVRIKQETNHGCAQVRPVQINREAIYVQRAGRKVRAFGYYYDVDGYKAPDLTSLAEHITRSGIVSMTYAQEPEQILWAVRADGKLLSCTIDRDQAPSVVAWCQHETTDFIECVASIPNGDREQVWAIVRRTINGGSVRYVEALDDAWEPWHPSEPDPVADDIDDPVTRPVYGTVVDCSLSFDDATGLTTFAVPHLIGREVDIVADGSKQPRQTVPAGGSITLTRASKRTLIGLPFRTAVRLLTPELQGPMGSAQSKPMRAGKISLRVLDTIGAKIKNNIGDTAALEAEEQLPSRSFGVDKFGKPPMPFTGLVNVTKLGWAKGKSEITIIQDDPMPMHLLGVVRETSITG